MDTLIKNFSPNYCSTVVKHTMDGKDVRFKIVAECGRCLDKSYSHLHIFIQTLNHDFVKVAMGDDIPNYNYVDYIWDEYTRIKKLKDNIKAAEDYIKKVF